MLCSLDPNLFVDFLMHSYCYNFRLQDVPVEFEFLRIIEDIKAKRPNFKVVHGPILRVGNTTEDLGKPAIDPNPRRKKDPIMVLDQHIVVNDFRLLDILKRYDPDSTMTLEPQQFLAACEVGLTIKGTDSRWVFFHF